MASRSANAYYSGPVSDHFDGERFFNPAGEEEPHGFGRFLSLQLTERWQKWPQKLADVRPVRPLPAEDKTRLTFIGHASWLLQSAGLNVLIDPVWAERASPLSFAGPKRARGPGIPFDDLPHIDAVLVTHNHYDHLDLETLGRLWRRDRPRLVTPLGNDTIIRPVMPDAATTVLDWNQETILAPRLRVHAVPTLHWSARGLRDRRHALWASFVIETADGVIYAVGDSGFGDGSTFKAIRARHPRIDLALLPIGAYEPRWFMRGQHMNPQEAVEAFELVGARRALGHHWGTFPLTAEAHDEPPKELGAALQRRGLESDRFRAVLPGHVQDL